MSRNYESKNVNLTLKQAAWLKAHPEINYSEFVRDWTKQLIQDYESYVEIEEAIRCGYIN